MNTRMIGAVLDRQTRLFALQAGGLSVAHGLQPLERRRAVLIGRVESLIDASRDIVHRDCFVLRHDSSPHLVLALQTPQSKPYSPTGQPTLAKVLLHSTERSADLAVRTANQDGVRLVHNQPAAN